MRGIIENGQILYHEEKRYILVPGKKGLMGSTKWATRMEEVYVDYENPQNFIILEGNKYGFDLVDGKAVLNQENTKYYNDLIFEGEFNITGRGMILTLSTSANALEPPIKRVSSQPSFGHPFHVGDIITYDGEMYRIRGIEGAKGMFGVLNDRIGLQVKKIESGI